MNHPITTSVNRPGLSCSSTPSSGAPYSSKTRSSKTRSMKVGQSLIEFTFVGIPLIFVLISIFEISRGMWMYHTLSYAAKTGVRFAASHGRNCSPSGDALNSCLINTQQIAQTIECAAVGIDPKKTNVSFIVSGSVTNYGTLDSFAGTLTSCAALNAYAAPAWPPDDGIQNLVGNKIEIQMDTPFNSAIAMFWPGSHPTYFGAVTLPASSSSRMLF